MSKFIGVRMDEEIYSKFVQYCSENGYKIGKRLEYLASMDMSPDWGYTTPNGPNIETSAIAHLIENLPVGSEISLKALWSLLINGGHDVTTRQFRDIRQRMLSTRWEEVQKGIYRREW